MKNNLIALCVLVVLCAGYSNNQGAYGFFRSETAWNGGAGHFHIGWFMRGFSEIRDVAIVGEQTGEATHGGGDMFFGLGYAITDNLALNIASSIHGDGVNYTDSDYNRASMGWGDTKLGLKLSLGSEKFAWSIGPVLSLPTGSDRSTALEQKNYPIFGEAYGNDGGVFRYFSSGAIDYGFVTDVSLKSKLMTLDLNGGYIDRNKNDDEMGWRNNYTIYRAALSWNLGKVVPFIEVGGVDYCGEDKFFTFIDDDQIFGANEVYYTPGISFRPGRFSLTLAFDVRAWEGLNDRAFPTPLTDSTNITTGWGVAPAWAGIFGFSYCVDFKPEGPKPAMLAGTVLNDKTNEPLCANISFYREGSLVHSTTSNTQGQFEFSAAEPGDYRIVASLDGYYEDAIEILVNAGEKIPLSLRLKPIPTEGELTINVIDLATKQPMVAKVKVGDEIEEETSTMTKTLKAGEYKITASVSDENYLPYERTIKIEAGTKTELEIPLVKKEFKIVLPEVYFETAKSEIKPESYPILDDAAKSIAKILSGNPMTKIEIQGHTDSRGSDVYNLKLSQDRAAAVKDYLVTKHNLDAERLIPKGYGESNPVVPNTTPENMAKNRRVEFVIVK
uniref:OmpA-like domain-containing protein n=1 Tax=candidate division WOR-3 bacterium TaxID=2052148 RepID=A0A7C4TCE6_UNCW3